MSQLINTDQVGFTLGRQAPDATRKIINLLKHSESKKLPSLFLVLDAEKAFDRIHWGYLHQMLTKFGFSRNILSAIMALYTTPSARVFADGVFSDEFNISNGMRQGCPFSTIIFTLLMEPLAHKIRAQIL